MAENRRKCLKCGHSPGVDPNTKLFRFPKPGLTNTLRCELWAKYCFPDGEWSSQEFQQKLHREHRMLCHRHFKRTSFSDYPQSTKKLHRFAVPDEEMPVFVPQPKPLNVMPLQDKTNVFTDVDNPIEIMLPTEGNEIKLPLLNQPSSSSKGLSEVKGNEAKKPLDEDVQIPVNSKKTAREKYLYNKCRKHVKRICQLRKIINRLKNKEFLQEITNNDSVQELMKKLTPTFALLLQAQIKNFTRKSRGRRWTPVEKIIALRLYKRSPTCYRLMRRLLCLPAQSSLRTLLGQFQMNVGINKNIFNILAKFAKRQKPSDNEYVLLFDEMSIKKNLNYNKKSDIIKGFQDHGHQGRSPQIASNALVFMVAGLRKKVKQPLAFYLSSGYVTADRLATLIKEVLRECYRAGLNIAATVCDMDGVNRRALGILGATVDRPCINVDDKEIVSIFDPPHLLKCFRNLLMKYDMKCNTDIKSSNNSGIGVAKWSHIIKFYELDSSNPNFVFAPALKQEHLNPNTKQKMKVKLAAQVFSHTVAAGMMAKISQGELTTDAVTTLYVIENIDKLFDSLNSDSSDLRRGKVFATNIKSSSPHLQFFREMRTFFKTIEFLGCNRAPPSKEGWVWTLNAVELLWKKITSKHADVKSLATRRLQQDPLENLFGCIRGNCGANVNPTAGQFEAALKTTILSNLEHITTGNCETDSNDSIIDNYKVLLSKTPTNICTEASTSVSQNVSNFSDMLDEFETFCDTETENEDSGEMQACAYVCGFLIKNLNNDDCEKCKSIFIASDKSQVHLFNQCKEYDELKSRLIYCTKDLIRYIECCSTEVNKILQDKGYEVCIKSKVLATVIINDEFLRICPLHFRKNKNYLLNSVFHICIKRFCVLKNRALQEEASKVALKKKINVLKHV